jgi:putative ABC transport system permease protein
LLTPETAFVHVPPLRGALTTLGVMIGVAAVVALIAIGRGSQYRLTSMITANGGSLLTVRSGASNQGGLLALSGRGNRLPWKMRAPLPIP